MAKTSMTLRNRLALSLVGAAGRLAQNPALLSKALGPLRNVDDRRQWLTLFDSRHLHFQTADHFECDGDDKLLAYSAVYACVTQISRDIAKLAVQLRQRVDRTWVDATELLPQGKVLLRPNHFQTRLQFVENWLTSKLATGNTYVFKRRKGRFNTGEIDELIVLDPARVRPLVSSIDGSVYYELRADDLARLHEDYTGENVVPASEIIHDRINCLFHPLVGISPIFACAISATTGRRIQANSAHFFGNQSMPGGVLTVPGEISDEQLEKLKGHFEQKTSGRNAGRVSVLSDGMQYQPLAITAHDAQLIEQQRWVVEDVARAFGVPLHMLNAGPAPTLNSIEAIEQGYYSRCLQPHIEALELCLDQGLELKSGYRTEFDLDGLLRMDASTQFDALQKGVRGGWLAPNEARAMRNLPPVAGGESPYLQHQDYSLSSLAKRDAMPNPFDPSGAKLSNKAGGGWVTKAPGSTAGADDDMDRQQVQELIIEEVRKAMAALPRPNDGKDGAPGPQGEPGRDLDAATANTLVAQHVEARLGGLVEKAIEDRVESIVAKTALLVPPGRDGLPGAPGRPGTSVDIEDVRQIVATQVASIPRPKDGRDGRDGLSPDDLTIELRDERTLVLAMHVEGRSVVRQIELKGMPIERGVYVHKHRYQRGDGITYASSYWIAQEDTCEPPPGNGWRMAVRGFKK